MTQTHKDSKHSWEEMEPTGLLDERLPQTFDLLKKKKKTVKYKKEAKSNKTKHAYTSAKMVLHIQPAAPGRGQSSLWAAAILTALMLTEMKGEMYLWNLERWH